MADNWLKKIWKDPVFSKIIAAFIIWFPTKIIPIIFNPNENNKVYFIINIIQSNSKNIFILFILILLLIVTYYYIKEKYSKKTYKKKVFKRANYKWLINLIRSEAKRYMFILWFPIHGQTSCEIYKEYSYEDRTKLMSKKTFNELLEKNVIQLSTGMNYFDIILTDNAYSLIDKYIKENYLHDDRMNDFINILKNSSIVDLLNVHLYYSDYIKP